MPWFRHFPGNRGDEGKTSARQPSGAKTAFMRFRISFDFKKAKALRSR
jgi:hypothetical protein